MRFLEDLNWIPMVAEDQKFPHLNVYANFAFYSGCMRKNVMISGEDETLEKIRDIIAGNLKIDSEIVYGKEGHGTIMLITEGGSYVARALESTGIPKECGPKAKQAGLTIPIYRIKMLQKAMDQKATDQDREFVRRMERDSASVLISTKTTVDSRGQKDRWQINYFARPTEDEARNIMELNLNMMKIGIPDLPITEDDIKTRSLESGSFHSYVNINGGKIDFFLDPSNRELIRFSQKMQNRYGFDLPFEPSDFSDLV
ncbi:MAG: hypothetical protein JW754_02160 [Candidatus Aenigmarchaeota archaeon]|nr:hypothetical protein [Candidatus Aenigmarchaeota archaeon]